MRKCVLVLLFLGLALSSAARAAITVLSDPSALTSPTTTIDFEGMPAYTVLNTYYSALGVEFQRDDGEPVPSYEWTALGRGTTSPTQVIATVSGGFPGAASTIANQLNIIFATPVFEVGAFFGNDQFAEFVTTLSLFDAADSFLGSVAMAGNNNTDVDQFLGLRSTTPFVRARFETNDAFFSVVLDDVIFGSSVPEPGTLALLGLGLAGLAATRRRKQ